MAAMTDTTPYTARPAKEVEREIECMRAIFAKAEPVTTIYEAFGGTGRTAKVLRTRFPRATIYATDLDKSCCDQYNAVMDAQAHCFQADATRYISELNPRPRTWGASLDFNRFTLMDLTRPSGAWKRVLIDQICLRKPKWVQITDSAVCYLQTNWWRYGVGERGVTASDTLPSYLHNLEAGLKKAYGLKMLTHAHHSRATYMLLKPTWR